MSKYLARLAELNPKSLHSSNPQNPQKSDFGTFENFEGDQSVCVSKKHLNLLASIESNIIPFFGRKSCCVCGNRYAPYGKNFYYRRPDNTNWYCRECLNQHSNA